MAKSGTMEKVASGLLKEVQNILEGEGTDKRKVRDALGHLKLHNQAKKLAAAQDDEEELGQPTVPAKPAQPATSAVPPRQEPKVEAPKIDPAVTAAVANGSATPEKKSWGLGR